MASPDGAPRPLGDAAGEGIQARLRRLRRPVPGSGAGADPLVRLEHSLLGDSDDELPLKERLQRLVEAASARSAQRRRGALGERFRGREVVGDRGTFLLVEKDLPIGVATGTWDVPDVPARTRDWLEQLPAVPVEAPAILTGDPAFAGFELSRAAFLDTETTGLSGGTGTAAFLIGVGSVEGDRFQVRQYFMRDYNEEPALLEALAADLARFDHLVTYNGRQFDVPLLETRYRLDRRRFPLVESLHLDLLHPARRLWKLRLESCRLQSLEQALLGATRVGDVPGDEIPAIYFRYIRGRDPGSLGRVLQHNLVDVISLAALAALACHWVSGMEIEDSRDCFSLARVLERAELHQRAEGLYRRALERDPGPLRAPAQIRLGDYAKRRGEFEAALGMWEEAAQSGECLAFRELAIHHERRRRDPSQALAVVVWGLERLGGSPDGCCQRTLRDFARRRLRLEAKLERLAPGDRSRETVSAP
jgi:hypothetical protein